MTDHSLSECDMGNGWGWRGTKVKRLHTGDWAHSGSSCPGPGPGPGPGQGSGATLRCQLPGATGAGAELKVRAIPSCRIASHGIVCTQGTRPNQTRPGPAAAKRPRLAWPALFQSQSGNSVPGARITEQAGAKRQSGRRRRRHEGGRQAGRAGKAGGRHQSEGSSFRAGPDSAATDCGCCPPGEPGFPPSGWRCGSHHAIPLS